MWHLIEGMINGRRQKYKNIKNSMFFVFLQSFTIFSFVGSIDHWDIRCTSQQYLEFTLYEVYSSKSNIDLSKIT